MSGNSRSNGKRAGRASKRASAGEEPGFFCKQAPESTVDSALAIHERQNKELLRWLMEERKLDQDVAVEILAEVSAHTGELVDWIARGVGYSAPRPSHASTPKRRPGRKSSRAKARA